MNSTEIGDSNQERGVYAVAFIDLPHSKCSRVVLLWHPTDGLIHCGNCSISERSNHLIFTSLLNSDEVAFCP